MTSLRAYVEYPYERDGSLQSVCPLNACCKEELASYYTKYQQNCKRSSEDVTATGRSVVRASHVPRKFLLKRLNNFLQKLVPANFPAITVAVVFLPLKLYTEFAEL